MKISLTSTDQITTLGGVQVRVWDGVTEDGVPCLVFVHRVVVKEGADRERFDRELQEMLPPGRYLDLRKVLP